MHSATPLYVARIGLNCYLSSCKTPAIENMTYCTWRHQAYTQALRHTSIGRPDIGPTPTQNNAGIPGWRTGLGHLSHPRRIRPRHWPKALSHF